MSDFAKVNAIYGTFFEKDPPARVAVAVKELPKGSKFEIECTIAYPNTNNLKEKLWFMKYIN